MTTKECKQHKINQADLMNESCLFAGQELKLFFGCKFSHLPLPLFYQPASTFMMAERVKEETKQQVQKKHKGT